MSKYVQNIIYLEILNNCRILLLQSDNLDMIKNINMK